ncbi:CDK5 and ABL1 enzyme substrate 1, partial [Cladochytrium tenue]
PTIKGTPLSYFSIIPAADTKAKQRRTRPRSRFGSQALERIGITLAIEAVRKKSRAESYAHLLDGSRRLRIERYFALIPTSHVTVPATHPGDYGYDPYYLDDPELRTGKHRTVINLPFFIGSIIQYSRPSEIKRELNERFRETHPTVDAHLTLSQIRNLKLRLVRIALTRNLELSSVAVAFVYFEKLVLKGFVTKPNRRLVAAVCLLLAAKVNDPKETDYSKLLE